MKSPTLIIFFTLVLTAQVLAQLLSYSEPISSTQWTAGKPATVSWSDTCGRLSVTTFPIVLYYQTGSVQVPVPGISPIGTLDCFKAGSTQVQIPATIPQGSTYSIALINGIGQSYSAHFTILNSVLPLSTSESLPIATTTASTTKDLPSILPSPSTGTATGNTKGSGVGVIVGGVVGAVVIVAAILIFIWRKKTSTKRTENDKEEAETDDYSQVHKQAIDQVTQSFDYNIPATTFAFTRNPQEAIPRNPQVQPENSDQSTKVGSFSSQNQAEPPFSGSPQWRHGNQETITSTAIVSPPLPSTLAPQAIPTLQDNIWLSTSQGISDESRRNLAQRELALLQAQYDLQMERLRAEQDIKIRNIQDRLG